MNFAELKLTRLFSNQILGEIDTAHTNPNFAFKTFDFDDDKYFLKRVNSSGLVFGYFRYDLWTDAQYLQPISLIKNNQEALLLPEFESMYSKSKYPSNLSIFKFSGVDRLVITIT
jgi:hypothetical protein